MSDFVPRDILPDLWEEILQRHWTYLETEESMQKLEERKKLEGCLKEFLCIVPHDRKFFLPETSHVLKKSIKEMDDFSAYKAMIGFESISQYANNLFTKPWRKEYRVIKMYSGFYQHEIKSNLIDADKLFEAMGYKQLPNQILMLDGPICPDQVTNVSRDAMAAYVECQIMKQIFSGLTSNDLSCSWSDIFNFRESHIGGASQAVRSIAYAVHERRFRKEKLNSENCYATIQPTQQQQQQPQLVPSCGLCAHTCHQQIPQIGNPCNHHQLTPQQQQYGGICSIHPQPPQNIYMQNTVAVPHHYKPSNYTPAQMSHSKSLEHYVEPHNNPTGILPHRHSFDQPYDTVRPHYDSVYDCVDGYQSCNFNAYNHPYNVSGNRYPLPYNISNQLNNQFPSTCGVNNVNHYTTPPPPPPPAMVTCGHKIPMNESNCYSKVQPDQMYGDCNGYLKKPQDVCNYHNSNGKDIVNYRQCTYGTNNRTNNTHTEHLIDFDDRPNDINSMGQQQFNRLHSNGFEYIDRNFEQPIAVNGRQHKAKQPPQNYEIPRAHMNTTNQTPKDLYSKIGDNSEDIPGNYMYARADKKPMAKKSSDKYSRNAEILEQYEKTIDNNLEPPRIALDSYDSYEEGNRSNGAINGGDSTRSNVLSNKNQDGVGSFESWDYVFQNLEKHGYTKDLGERGDLLMRGLDLDSMNISNSSEKRRSRNLDNKLRPNTETSKSKTLEKTDVSKDTITTTINQTKPKVLEKSILKHDNETVQKTISKTTQVQKSVPAQKPKSSKISTNNNNDENTNNTTNTTNRLVNRTSNNERSMIKSNGTTGQAYRSSGTATASTDVPNPNEWSCRFCTYLNPDTKRICEMCCRSRDFVLDTAKAPTCV